MQELSPEIKSLVENFSTFQKAYCEYRAKGLSQYMAAKKAGSTAQDNSTMGKVGYQVEQIPGAKEYIDFLVNQRMAISVIDGVTIINLIKNVYDTAMKNDNLKEANAAAKMLGEAIGLFGKKGTVVDTQKLDEPVGGAGANAFTADDEDGTNNKTKDRLDQLQQMLKDLNKSK